MNIVKAWKLLRKLHPVFYYRVRCFHRELLGHNKPVNVWQLQELVGSEPCSKNFEKADIPEHCLSYIPLRKIPMARRGLWERITPKMQEKYDWYGLADSLKKEGFRVPVLLKESRGKKSADTDGTFVVVEGKHRVTAVSLIKPYNPDVMIPSLVVDVDPFYTIWMFHNKKRHPFPHEDRTIKFERSIWKRVDV